MTELWAAIAASNPGKRAAGNTEQKLAKGLQMWTDFFDHSIQPGVIARPHPNSGRPASSGIQPVDHGELSQLLQRGVGAVCHRVSLFQSPWSPALP